MKILKVLKEQEETNPGLETIDGGTYKLVEKLNEIQELLKKESYRTNDISTSPDGSFKYFGSLYCHKPQDNELTLEVKPYIILTADQIPNDFLEFISEDFYNRLEKSFPSMMEFLKSDDCPPHTFNFSFRDIFVSYKETFLSLYDHMDRPYYNTHIANLIPLEDVLQHNYTLDPTQVPTFSDEYSLAADRELKKIKSVYRGFRKGSYKGHTYEYTENEPRISIHLTDTQNGQRVIQPRFNSSINAGYFRVDGKPTGGFTYPPEEDFQDKEYVRELNTYLKNRFAQFGIKIM
jgi:hypothetical protein